MNISAPMAVQDTIKLVGNMARHPRPKNVRFALERDAKSIFDLLVTASEQIPYAQQLQDESFAAEGLLRIAQECKRRLWYIVDGEDSAAGVLLLWGNEILYLVVAEKNRNNGVASDLLSYAKHLHQESRVKTKESNSAMIALLKKEGYKPERYASSDGWPAFKWIQPRRN